MFESIKGNNLKKRGSKIEGQSLNSELHLPFVRRSLSVTLIFDTIQYLLASAKMNKLGSDQGRTPPIRA